MSDWYLERGEQRLAALRAGRAQALADLEAAKRDADADAADNAIAYLADINQQEANTIALYNQYAQSQMPPPEPDEATLQAMPVQNMTHNQWFQYLNKHSKYGVDVDAYRRGMAEVAARRARGE
jgi:hypothetical protein